MKLTYHQAVRKFQRNLLAEALIEAKGNVCEAALALQIHRNTFARALYAATSMTPGQVCAILREEGRLAPREAPLPKAHLRYVRSGKPAEKLSSSRAA